MCKKLEDCEIVATEKKSWHRRATKVHKWFTAFFLSILTRSLGDRHVPRMALPNSASDGLYSTERCKIDSDAVQKISLNPTLS